MKDSIRVENVRCVAHLLARVLAKLKVKGEVEEILRD